MASNDDRAATPKKWAPETQLVHGGTLRSQFGETSEAMFLTQGFVYASAEQAEARFKNEDPGFQYSRFGNPTVAMFEERVRLLEGAEEARATASGMAAVNAAVMSYVKAGDHIVSARALFGACRYVVETLAPRYGITSTLIDGRDLDAWQKAVRPNTKLFFFETPSNPTLELVDIAAVCKIAKQIGAIVVVDNVFATPLASGRWSTAPTSSSTRRPSTSTARAAVSAARCSAPRTSSTNHLQEFLRQTGPTMSPFNAWVMLKGLETMPVRVRRRRRQRPSSPITSPASRTSSACSIAAAPTIRRPTSPSGR